MARFIKDRTALKGQVPGSLILIGKQKMDKPVIQLMEVDADNLIEKELSSIEEAAQSKTSKPVSWINICGIHDTSMMQQLGEIFELDPLFLEDVLNTDQRPRYEDAGTFDAFILKMLKYDNATSRISAEQFTLILGKNYIITLQEQPGDVFDPVRERIPKREQGSLMQITWHTPCWIPSQITTS